jgi:Protein of unknown function (DUF4232)
MVPVTGLRPRRSRCFAGSYDGFVKRALILAILAIVLMSASSAEARRSETARAAWQHQTTARQSPHGAMVARAGDIRATRAAVSARDSRRSACAAADLVVWLDTTSDAAAGSTYLTLEFTNLSGRACTLEGYPGVSAVDLAARRIGSAGGRNRRQAARAVTLATGATARAVLQIVQAANYPSATCRQVPAAGLRVFPPGSTRAKLIPFPFTACARRGPAILRVGVVTAR